jgi:hypothetical protein
MMHDNGDDYIGELAARRLFQKLEQLIRESNRKEISEHTGGVSEADLTKVAQLVSHLRADYLSFIFSICHSEIDINQVNTLHRKRLIYEELLRGFGALRHAVSRGYISIENSMT